MPLIFRAKKHDQARHSKLDVEAVIRVGLSGILNFGVHTTVSKKQKEIVKSYAIKSRCYT